MGYKHKYVVGNTYAFYNNSDDLETNANFASWSLELVHADDFVQVISGVATLTKDIISGSSYRWYADDFTFPTVDNGCYRFIVIDTSASNAVLYISNTFEVTDSTEGLKYVLYRNGKDILNYNYETLTSFKNKFHVELLSRKALVPISSDGYDISTGSYFRVRTIVTKNYEFVTGWFDEDEHDAMQGMIIHNDLSLEVDNSINAVDLAGDAEYAIEWQENYEYIQASVRLQITDRSSSNKAL